MTPTKREGAIRVGDVVFVPVRYFGEQYARSRAVAHPTRISWASNSLRDAGTVLDKSSDNKFLLDFDDGQDKQWWTRKPLGFESRPSATRGTTKRRREVEAESDAERKEPEEEMEVNDVRGYDEVENSSAEEDNGAEDEGDCEG